VQLPGFYLENFGWLSDFVCQLALLSGM